MEWNGMEWNGMEWNGIASGSVAESHSPALLPAPSRHKIV
jgi:hypothetical protein